MAFADGNQIYTSGFIISKTSVPDLFHALESSTFPKAVPCRDAVTAEPLSPVLAILEGPPSAVNRERSGPLSLGVLIANSNVETVLAGVFEIDLRPTRTMIREN